MVSLALSPWDAGDPYLRATVLNSLRIGLEAGAAALAPAFLIAFVLERRTWPGAPLLVGCVWTLLLTPSYLLVAGWQIRLHVRSAWRRAAITGRLLLPVATAASPS